MNTHSASQKVTIIARHSSTKDITLDHHSPPETEKYTMILEGDRLRRWFGSYPPDLEDSCIRLKLEYWSELIGLYDEYNDCILDLQTAKDYCLDKTQLADIDEKLKRYYTKALSLLKRLKTRPDRL